VTGAVCILCSGGHSREPQYCEACTRLQATTNRGRRPKPCRHSGKVYCDVHMLLEADRIHTAGS
jgi:hypothetical protein